MTYGTLYNDFAVLFKDKNVQLEKLIHDANVDTSDGMHIMFSFVVVPFVYILLEDNDTVNLKKAFDYFEKMAKSTSSDITEVLEFTVLENLASGDYDNYNKFKKFMGKITLECCKNVERFLDFTDELL